MRFLIISLLMLFTHHVSCGEIKAIATIRSNVSTASLGSTYDWQFIVSPWSDEIPTKDAVLGDEFVPFIYITDIYKMELSPNNNEALVIDVKGILAKDYRQPSLKYIKINDSKIALRYDLPQNVETFEVDGSFTLMSRANPFAIAYLPWVLLSLVVFLLIGFIAYRLMKKTKIKKESFLFRVRDYSDKGKLELFYRERQKYIEREGAKELIDSIESLQYRPDWTALEKKELVTKLEDLFREVQ